MQVLSLMPSENDCASHENHSIWQMLSFLFWYKKWFLVQFSFCLYQGLMGVIFAAKL